MSSALADLARAQLARGLPLRLTATGHSMWPTVRDGAHVDITPLGPERPGVGAIVLLDTGDRLVLHRVIALTEKGPVTKGDALPHADGVAPWSAVLGRYLARETPLDPALAALSRHGGRPLAWLLTRLRVALARHSM